MPRSILGSLFICTVVYILFAFVMTGLTNYKTLDVAAPVAIAIAKTPFPWLQWVMQLAILAGLTSVVLAFLLGQSRVFYVMACDGLLPKCFAELHPTLKTPWKSNLILMVFVSAIAAFAPITFVGHMTSIGTLLAFATVCLAVIIMRHTDPTRPRPFKVPAFPLVPIVGMLICLVMMASLGFDNWMRLLIWLAIGLVIYFGYRKKLNTEAQRHRE
jgi:APA family basic amino acid/polyamine antiporter